MTDPHLQGDFIAGYVTGEGSFFITFHRRSFQIGCGFSIKVRADDRELLRAVWQTLMFAGNLYEVPAHRRRSKKDKIHRHHAVLLLVRKLDELTGLVIPFFDQYPLHGQKRRNYDLWKQAVRLLDNGEHLTPAGLEKILWLKDQMNRYQGQDETEDLPSSDD